MKSLVFGLIAMLTHSQLAFAGDAYGSCYVENGVAHALFCSQTSASGSGTGYVTSFDRSGSQLDREMIVWVGVAVMGCDEVETISVDRDAVGCSFNLGR